MRDVFFDEVETDDPEDYVRQLLSKTRVEITGEMRTDGGITVFAVAGGLTQKFIFTPI